MKIALLSFLFESEIGGGAAAAARTLADGLIKQGFQVVVITTHARQEISIEHVDDLTIYRFFPWNLYWVGEKDLQPVWKKTLWQLMDVWNPFSFRVVRHILTQERPDIVHVHKLRGLSPSVWTAARAAGMDTIIQTCHDHELMSPEGTLNGRVGSWAQQGVWFLRPYQQIRAGFSQAIAAATAPSRYILDMHSKSGFFRSAYTSVVPNSHGLTLEQLDQRRDGLKAKYSAKERTTQLLYLGRLEAIKGVDILCAAFERCAARFPNLRLDIAGWGALEERLRQQYGHHPQITFHGPVFSTNKSLLLETSDVLIMPSVCPEAFGIVIAEAYAHGVPVIATRSGGIPELVEEGRTGFLVPSGDVKALTEMICRLAENPGEVRQMALVCLEMGRRFATEPINKGYLSVYETVSGPTF